MFNNLIVSYLFLGGMGAGACCALSVLGFAAVRSEGGRSSLPARRSISSRRLFGFGYLLAAAVCAVGAVCLLADMRRPDDILVLLLSPTLSVVSVGAYTLAATMVLAVASGLAWLGAFSMPPFAMRVAAVVHSGLSLAVMAYTALLLMAFPGVPLFQSPLLIVLFLASSLSCGAAAAVLCGLVTRTWNSFSMAMRRLVIADAVVLVVELFAVAAFVLTGLRDASESAWRLIAGEQSAVFWIGLVVAGLAAPLVLNVLECCSPVFRIPPALPAVLVLVGGFALRWCILAAA